MQRIPFHFRCSQACATSVAAVLLASLSLPLTAGEIAGNASDPSASYISARLTAETGDPAKYRRYSNRLAWTLSHFSPEQLARVLGVAQASELISGGDGSTIPSTPDPGDSTIPSVPNGSTIPSEPNASTIPSEPNGATTPPAPPADPTPAGPDGGSTQTMLDLINQIPPLNSSHLKNALLDALPSSDFVLETAILRNEPMQSSHIRMVLEANAPLSSEVLSSAIHQGGLLNSDHLRDVLLTSSPLPPEITQLVRNKTASLTREDRRAVLDAQK